MLVARARAQHHGLGLHALVADLDDVAAVARGDGPHLVGHSVDLVVGEMLDELVHELIALHGLGKPGIVLDLLGHEHLSAGRKLLDEQSLHARADEVQGGGEPGRPTADDDGFVCFHVVLLSCR